MTASAGPADTPGALPWEGAPLHTVSDSESPEVRELDQNPRFRTLRDFHSRFLAEDRDITVYLPAAYLTDPARRFPVFYLHDGQNLFDPRTSYAGFTWRAHCALDAEDAAGRIDPPILVGIANTGVRRMAEYTPTRDRRFAGGDGLLYGRLIVEELKPLIDRTFRTLPARDTTALGGSSLGGLISLALGLRYPDTFGKLAVVSPSVWWDGRSLLAAVSEAPVATPIRSTFRRAPTTPASDTPKPKIWLDMGTGEGLRHLRDCDLLHRRLLAHGWRETADARTSMLRYTRVPGGVHNEDAWAARFPEILRFLYPPA